MTNDLGGRPASQEIGREAPVSVIIPCYSCADTIERAVESVMAQTVRPAEIWLIEDGTEDGGRTLAKLHQLQRCHGDTVPIGVIPLERNLGCAVARNAGWDACTQPYVTFLDADDSWHPRKLEIQYNWMREHSDVVMTGHKWLWIPPGKFESEPLDRWKAQKVSPSMQLLRSRFSTITVMLRRDLPYRFTNSKRSSDFDMWLKIILDGHSAWRLGVPLARVYKAPYGAGGLSGNLWEAEKAELGSYWRQVQEHRLRLVTFALLVPWSVAKYVQRLVIIGIRRRALTR